jgi:Ca2+/H+ antiporter, TMEM165/GDT1 family
MSESIILPFLAILLAEFLDKSQLSLLLLASKTKHHFPLLLGSLLAFLIVDGIAILFGSFLTTFIPHRWITLLAAVLFILFGLKSLMERHDEKPHIGNVRHAFLSAFTLIFLSEWGDKTQVASALFATTYPPLSVLIGVMLALTILTVTALFIGRILTSRIERRVITKIAGIIFIVLGISFFLLK